MPSPLFQSLHPTSTPSRRLSGGGGTGGISTAAAAAATASHTTPRPDYLRGLNPEQLEAVTSPIAPTRVIAGPGSGKTRVLTSRIAHLIAHHGVRPWQIVAITFTNKSAIEMRERLAKSLGESTAKELFAGTFHSLCYRILRRSLEMLPNTGRATGWSLYDQEAAASVIYKLVRSASPELKSGEAREEAKRIQSRISKVKNGVSSWHGLSSTEVVALYYENQVVNKGGDVSVEFTPGQKASAADLATWFELYEDAMRAANALDFDDLLGYTTALLHRHSELRTKLRRRWRHILVDETQDTNGPQYELLKLLAAARNDGSNGSTDENKPPVENSDLQQHIFAVGDPDQSIYGWRGADMRNMKHAFGLDFPASQVYFLRDNYRSSPTIIAAAEAVISRNQDGGDGRGKLIARCPDGPPIHVMKVVDAYEEAEYIAGEIAKIVLREQRCRDRDIAVLFRTHQQARLIEQQLVKRNIPYILVGGTSFWRRVEIQDVLAYLRLAVTLDDDVALMRTINTPKRGIGDASVAKLVEAAESQKTSLSKQLFGDVTPSLPSTSLNEEEGGKEEGGMRIENDEASSASSSSSSSAAFIKTVLSGKAATSLAQFRASIGEMHHAVTTQPLSAALHQILVLADYETHVKKGGCGGKEEHIDDRLARLRQLCAAAVDFKAGMAAGAAALEAAFDDYDEEDDDEERRREISFESDDDGHAVIDIGSPSSSSSSALAAVGDDDDCIENNDTTTPEARLELARAFLDEAALYSGADEGTDVDGVRLMTMHAAKGLEFEIVFVPGCIEGLVPLYSPGRGDTEKELEEETRLFFVSMTRAKRELRLVFSEWMRHQGPANTRQNKPSRFLRDIAQAGGDVTKEVSLGSRVNSSSNSGGSNSGGRNVYDVERRGRSGRYDNSSGSYYSAVSGTSSTSSRSSSSSSKKSGDAAAAAGDGGGDEKEMRSAQKLQQRRSQRR